MVCSSFVFFKFRGRRGPLTLILVTSGRMHEYHDSS